MMDGSANLNLPYIAASQAQKHITHNEAIRVLDALVQLCIKSSNLTAPPDSPSDGDRYIVKAQATDEWGGKEGQIAAYQDNYWMFFSPLEGWLAWIVDERKLYVWGGSSWDPVLSENSINPVPLLGINTIAADPEKLAVKSDAVLFSYDDTSSGTGDILTKLNKVAVGNTASFLFQDNWSGRAEIGLTGDDDFHFKVSADGETWREGLVINSNTGRISAPSGGMREQLSANRTYYVNGRTGSNHNDGLTPDRAFATIQYAVDHVQSLDLLTYRPTIKIADGVYNESVVLRRVLGGPEGYNYRPSLIGNESDPSAVVINSNLPISANSCGSWHIRAIKMNSTSTNCMYVDSFSHVEISNVVFGDAATHIYISRNAILHAQNTYEIAGTATYSHVVVVSGGIFQCNYVAVTLSGAVEKGYFVRARGGTIIFFNSTFTITGAVSCTRYLVTHNGIIDTNGKERNYFPGSLEGTAASGGVYA